MIPKNEDELLLVRSQQLESKAKLEFDGIASRNLTDETFVQLLENISSLSEISWFHGLNEVTDKGIDILKEKVKDLTSLQLPLAEKISERALSELISKANLLRYINLSGCQQINKLFAKALKNCPCIEKLDLSDCEGIQHRAVELILLNCPNLKWLDLQGCKNCTGRAFSALHQNEKIDELTSLEVINLDNCPSITDEEIKHLSLMGKNLKTLSLKKNKQITDAIVPIIASLEKLESLDLSFCEKITDGAFEPLNNSKHFSSLKVLKLSETSVTYLSVKKLTRMNLKFSLEHLNLNRCPGIDIKALDFFPLFTRLTHLEIERNNLNKFSSALNKLSHCKHLEILNINYLRSSKHITFDHGSVLRLISWMPRCLKELHVVGLGSPEDYQEASKIRKNLVLIH